MRVIFYFHQMIKVNKLKSTFSLVEYKIIVTLFMSHNVKAHEIWLQPKL